MLYITQLIYIKDGQEDVFHQFEDLAIHIISRYKGRLLLRVRPTENTFIAYNVEKPYEIHLVEFDSEQNFQDFLKDDERKQFLHLKDQSIKSVFITKGTAL